MKRLKFAENLRTAGREPKLTNALLELSRFLGVSLDELVGGGENSKVNEVNENR